MLFVALRNLMKLCRYRRTFAVLSWLSFTITALSFLVLVEKSLFTYQHSLSQEYLFLKSESPQDVVSIYNDIRSNELLPEIVSISLIDNQYTGIYYDASLFQMFMPYGRLFSQEEIDAGKNVVLLSLEYIRNLPLEKADSIWNEGVDIADNHYDAVGGYTDIARYFSLSDLCLDFPMPTLVVMPEKTYLASGNKPLMLNCHFAGILSNEQQKMLAQIISAHESVDHYYIPGTKEAIRNSLLESLSAYSAILFMALIAVVLIIVFWFRSESVRYEIYLICGAKKRHIVFFCTINILLLNLFSYLSALAGLNLINRWFEGRNLIALPATWRVFIGVAVFVFCWLVVILRSLSFLKHYRNVSSIEVV